MKELSIGEKAKAYDEALSVARKTHQTQPMYRDWLEKMFPELKESENDRIKKAIKYGLEHVFTNNTTVYETTKEQCLSWLEKQGKDTLEDSILDSIEDGLIAETIRYKNEKQGEMKSYISETMEEKHDFDSGFTKMMEKEQKPADKVEPKFHEDDWIVHHGTENIYQVVAIIDNQYQLKYGDNYTTQYCEDVDRCARLWDITKDVKDGDVLATLDYILIFKEFFKNDGGISYCHYDFGAGNPQFIWSEDRNWYFGKEAIVHPATKEQRDLLFQKMKEAGYEWDAEKKELKKIEQNAWSEEDENRFNNLIFLVECSDENKPTKKGFIDFINRLKSTSHKKQWKPSDEQMIALRQVISGCSYDIEPLVEIEKQLKKLKG